MRKILLIAISGISFCTMPVQAQFNTIAKTPERYKVEALQEGMKKPEPTPESMAPAQETSTNPADESKKLWIDRYLSVSYPLQRIRITSPYGYRKDPFTGKRKFHGGIDLHARGEQVLAMMEGVVVKVGQDVRQVCDTAARKLHRQLLPPFTGAGRQGYGSPSPRCRRYYRLDRTKYRRALARHLQAKWQEYQSLGSLRLHQIHAAGVCVGISWTVIGLLSQHLIQVTVIQKFDFSSSIFECTRIGHRLTQYGFFDPAVHLFQRLLEVRMVGHRRLDFNTV